MTICCRLKNPSTEVIMYLLSNTDNVFYRDREVHGHIDESYLTQFCKDMYSISDKKLYIECLYNNNHDMAYCDITYHDVWSPDLAICITQYKQSHWKDICDILKKGHRAFYFQEVNREHETIRFTCSELDSSTLTKVIQATIKEKSKLYEIHTTVRYLIDDNGHITLDNHCVTLN